MKTVFTILFCVMAAAAVSAQTIVGRQLQITLNTGDGTYPTSKCLLWLPDDYSSTSTNYPLIINMPGAGETGTDINNLLHSGQMAKRIADGYNPVGTVGGTTYKYIVFTPMCPVAASWSSPHISNFLTQLKAQYRIDANRVYITGLSYGTWGSWRQLQSSSFANQIAAIGIASPAPVPDNINWLDAASGKDIPIWFAACADSYDYTNMITQFNYYNSHGGHAIKSDIPTGGHSAWNKLYDPTWTGVGSESGGKNFYDWLIQYSLDGGDGVPTACGSVIDINSLRPGGDSTGKTFNAGSGFAPCDTLELYGKWTYVTFQHIHGTPDKHIVIRNKPGQTVDVTNGFSFDSCSYIDLIGEIAVSGGDTSYKIKVHDDKNKTSPGVSFIGLSKNMTGRFIEIYNKTYGYWIKQESNTVSPPCDSTQWYPHFQDSIIVEYNHIHEMNQEGMYIGSTDPLGLASERAVTCWDSTFTPRSAEEHNIFVRYNKVRNTVRTGIQASAHVGGEIAYNTLINCGGDNGGTQWSGIWQGGASRNVKIHHNYIDSTLRDNITYYGTKGEIYNNVGRHNGVHRNWNTDNSITTLNYYNNLTVSIRTTKPYEKTQFNIHDNDFETPYPSTSSNVWIEGNAVDYESTGNYICNSGNYAMQHSIPLEACSETPPAKVTRYLKIGSKYLRLKITKEQSN